MKKEDLRSLYENIYKYQILNQEAKFGDRGLPKQLPDKAQIELFKLEEKLKPQLRRELEDLIKVAENYQPRRLPDVEELRQRGRELLETSPKEDLVDLIDTIYGTTTVYEDYMRRKYGINEAADVAKEMILADPKLFEGFMEEALDGGTKPFFEIPDFSRGSVPVEKDKGIEDSEIQMKKALDLNELGEMIIAFQYGLTMAHHNSPLASKYLGVGESAAVDILRELSNMDTSKLDFELGKVLGYEPGKFMAVRKEAKSVSDLEAVELDAIVDAIYDMDIDKVIDVPTEYLLLWFDQDFEIEDRWKAVEDDELVKETLRDPEFKQFVKYDPAYGVLSKLKDMIYKFEREIIQNGKIPIYRAIVVPDEWFTRFPETGKRLGKWWSWDPESAKPYGYGGPGGTEVVFMAEVDEDHVDWVETLTQNLSYAFGDEGAREREITLFKNTPVKLKNVWLDGEEIDDELFFEWFAPKTFYASDQSWSKVAMPPQIIEGAEGIIERIYELTYKYQVLNSQEYLSDRANIELLKMEPELKRKLQQGIKIIIEGSEDWRVNEQKYIDYELADIRSKEIAKYKDELARDVCSLMKNYLEKEDIIICFQNEFNYSRREIEENFFDGNTFLEDTCANFLSAEGGRFSINLIDNFIERAERNWVRFNVKHTAPFIDMIISSQEDYEEIVFSEKLPQVKPIEDMIKQLKSVQTSNDITDLVQNFNYGLTMVHHNGPLAEWVLGEDAISVLDSFESPERVEQWNKELQRVLGKPVEFEAPVQEWFQPEAFKRKAINIDKKDISEVLWYENDDGDKFIPDLSVNGHPGDPPKGYDIFVSRFPCHLRTTYLMMIDPEEVKNCNHPEEFIHSTNGWIDGVEGRECRQCGGHQIRNIDEDWPEEWDTEGHKSEFSGESGWPQDLVLAIVESGDFNLEEAIVIGAESCERCMNALADKYGLDWGYPEGSEEWEECGTSCDFCTNEKKAFKKISTVDIKTIEELYEMIYKYQTLRQEAKMGDYGLPQQLSDLAYLEFEKLSYTLDKVLENVLEEFAREYWDWLGIHPEYTAEGAFRDFIEFGMYPGEDRPATLRDVIELGIVSKEEVDEYMKKYPDINIEDIMDSDYYTRVLLYDLKDVIAGRYREGKYDDIFEQVVDSWRKDPDHPGKTFFDVERMYLDLIEGLEAPLDEKIKVFNLALNVAHHSGEMADHILSGMPWENEKILEDLSEGAGVERWDYDLQKLLGYPPRSRLPETKLYGHLNKAFQILDSNI